MNRPRRPGFRDGPLQARAPSDGGLPGSTTTSAAMLTPAHGALNLRRGQASGIPGGSPCAPSRTATLRPTASGRRLTARIGRPSPRSGRPPRSGAAGPSACHPTRAGRRTGNDRANRAARRRCGAGTASCSARRSTPAASSARVIRSGASAIAVMRAAAIRSISRCRCLRTAAAADVSQDPDTWAPGFRCSPTDIPTRYGNRVGVAADAAAAGCSSM